MLGQFFSFFLIALMLISALAVVLFTNPVYSVLSLLICMGCLSVLFFLLGSPFLAVLQILVYAGAVLVLFLFVVMLLNLQEEAQRSVRKTVMVPAGILLSGGIFFLISRTILAIPHLQESTAVHPTPSTVKEVAEVLFRTYFLPFEMTSFLMLVAVIGAVTLVRRPKSKT